MGGQAAQAPGPEGPSFEEALARLEEVVRTLEGGGLTLEEMLRLYEEGMHLARRCEDLLAQAEVRITSLQASLTRPMRFLPLEEGKDA